VTASGRLAFFYASMTKSIQSHGSCVVKIVLQLKIVATSIPEYVLGWCVHGFESHSQPIFAGILQGD